MADEEGRDHTKMLSRDRNVRFFFLSLSCTEVLTANCLLGASTLSTECQALFGEQLLSKAHTYFFGLQI